MLPADTVKKTSGAIQGESGRLDLSYRGRFQICVAYFEGVSSHFASDQHEEWRTKLLGGMTATSLSTFLSDQLSGPGRAS